MLYLSGKAGGTGDGTAVTEREARYRQPVATPAPDSYLALLARQQTQFHDGFNLSMPMGGFAPMGGSSLFGPLPMMTGFEHYETLRRQQAEYVRAAEMLEAQRLAEERRSLGWPE